MKALMNDRCENRKFLIWSAEIKTNEQADKRPPHLSKQTTDANMNRTKNLIKRQTE